VGYGASLSHQDRWRGKPYHVTGHRIGPRHITPLAVPPCMARHRLFAAPWQQAQPKVLVLKKNSVRFKISLQKMLKIKKSLMFIMLNEVPPA